MYGGRENKHELPAILHVQNDHGKNEHIKLDAINHQIK